MRAGRVCIVGFPIVITLGAIIAFMVGVLAGITHHSLYSFSIDLEHIKIDQNLISDIVGNLVGRDLDDRAVTISAADLGLGDQYEISLWGYCEITNGKKDCIKGEYDWASHHIRKDFLDKIPSVVKIPDEVDSAVDLFNTVTRYTEIAFIAALAALGVELFFGLFSICTRIMSCLTWVVAIIAIVLCIAAAGLATAMGAIIVGMIEAKGKDYGVKASINTSFLATIWIGAALAVVASLFWAFSVCCCKPEHRSGKRHLDDDNEKLMPTGAYYPVTEDHTYDNTYHNNQFQPTYGHDYSHGPTAPSAAPSYYSGGRSEAAYEPYSHRAY